MTSREDKPEVPGNQDCTDVAGRFPPAAGCSAGVARLASFLSALEDPFRLRILEFLCKSELTSQECAAAVGLAEGCVLDHLGCLADRGYVRIRQADAGICYRVSDRRVAEFVQLARSLAADNRVAVSTCIQMDHADEIAASGFRAR